MEVTKAELRSRMRAGRRERRRETEYPAAEYPPTERLAGGHGLEAERDALRVSWENACLFFGISPYAPSTLPALFMPLPTEPAVSAIVERSPRCLLPIVFDEAGAALPWPQWGLHVGGEDDLWVGDARWPAQPRLPVEPALWDEVSIVLVPALAVDRGGARVGQGGGWYDRALSVLPEGVPVVASVFDDEVVEAGLIPVEPHDRFIDGIICLSGFIPCDS
ncbi:5-formyltetrahydrofolate cyclo-ligase [Schaalia sp. Marseille-Q2122]|uniref:5-formyltetrahydrofolate cyclo-ligase n=1 Tax=Schaalia sp. Marseille-Q2122 TaxID=2736604 RepID=UPI0020CA4B7E|nr:5-formyltetrahydrofolate cyclo-ligase [Schaalia sp. Marseille-Q2122]